MTDVSSVVRVASPDEALAIRRILDAAMLEFAPLPARIAAGDVFVAVRASNGGSNGETTTVGGVLGALVVTWSADVASIDALAVRRVHRGRGIGTDLVAAAVDHAHEQGAAEIRARFDASLESFYRAREFEIVERDGDRSVGRRLL